MQRAVLAAFFLFPLFLTGQTLERGFGVETFIHQGNRRITGGAGVVFSELERQDSLESGRGGYGLGLVYENRVDKIGFTTGLRYLQTGYDVQEQSIGGLGSGRTFAETVTAHYLSVPFELNFYQDIRPKDRVSFSLGLAAHLHLATNTERTSFLDGNEVSRENIDPDPNAVFRSPVISLNTSVGYDRKLGDNYSLRLQPSFQFFLQGNFLEDPDRTNRNFYQLGLRLVFKRLI
ncbi:outer membrane beta-barrel protein [Neolewinella lacunae]|uniref:Outer membrane beta-barrel protein n=1 Tax=Neolewinella lacunae TaxID=1517758 RepID=A0A923PTY6_9BACT|nr:outer membrane beta-barrel protein [Neolewinella lacunae]MBC6996757.1 outer membrane beta-barrel protein [Neolewinella lacunae]MDN3633877.1 outer membrane beta-barrel protein [Neolewinella lacunae]